MINSGDSSPVTISKPTSVRIRLIFHTSEKEGFENATTLRVFTIDTNHVPPATLVSLAPLPSGYPLVVFGRVKQANATRTTDEPLPTIPTGGIREQLAAWRPGQFYEDHLNMVRSTNAPADIFLAQEALSPSNNWLAFSEELGRGAFGEVVRVGLPAMGRTFALKRTLANNVSSMRSTISIDSTRRAASQHIPDTPSSTTVTMYVLQTFLNTLSATGIPAGRSGQRSTY